MFFLNKFSKNIVFAFVIRRYQSVHVHGRRACRIARVSAVVLLIAQVRYFKILTSLRDFLVIFLYLVYFFALKLPLAIARQ